MKKTKLKINLPAILIVDKGEQDLRVERLERLYKKVESLVNEWSKLKIGEIPGGLPALLRDPVETHRKACLAILSADLPKSGRFAINPVKVLENYQTPDISAITTILSDLGESGIKEVSRFFKLEKGKVVETEAATKYLDEAHLWARNEEDLLIWETLETLCDKINNINRKHIKLDSTPLKITPHMALRDLLQFNRETMLFEPGWKGYKYLKSDSIRDF